MGAVACGLAYYLNGEAQVCTSVARHLRFEHKSHRLLSIWVLAVQGNTAAVADDIQDKGGNKAIAANDYTAQFTVYTQRSKSLADEVRTARKHLV